MAKRMSSILVDDDAQVLAVMSEKLRLEGHSVAVAENGRRTIEKIQNDSFDLVITELIMREKEGLETIADIRKYCGELPIIAISGGGRVGPADYLETARFIGANMTLAKPFGRTELIKAVSKLLA